MITDCGTCGGTGRVVYHGDGWETECPDCDGRGHVDAEPEDPHAVREPEGKAA